MRHLKAGIKLNRTSSHRNAMFRNMVTSLFDHGRVTTTEAKAKELRRWADRMVTLAKRGDLHARRQALAVMRNKNVVHKLFETAQERFGGSEGGYTRVTKLGFRAGDAAPMSLVELAGITQGGDAQKKSWLRRSVGGRKDEKAPEKKEDVARLEEADGVQQALAQKEGEQEGAESDI
ncbi:50S ribosomal protein L17 [Thermodesulfobacteriota bacterium]